MEPEFKIDLNQITHDLLETQASGLYGRLFSTLMRSYVRHEPVSRNFEGYTDPAQVKRVTEYDNATGHLAQLQYDIYSDPNNPKWDEFFRYWDFMQVLFPDASNIRVDKTKLMLVLNKLNVFSEENQLGILKHIRHNINIEDPMLFQAIMIKIANNKYATPFDKADAARETHNRDIIRDAIEDLKNALHNELQKDFPNIDVIKQICAYAQSVAQSMRIHIEEQSRKTGQTNAKETDAEMQYIKTVQAEFDINKVLAVGAEYVPQINKSLEERAVLAENRAKKAEAEVTNLEQRMKQNNETMQRQNSQLSLQLSTEQGKNVKLTEEANKLRKENEEYKSWVKTAKIRAATLKTGLFAGNAIKEFQEFLQRGPQIPER